MASKINDLLALGFTVGIAHGAVDTEELALDEAKTNAQPQIVAEQADEVTRMTVQALDAEGKLPKTQEGRRELASRIAESALDYLTTRADELVSFHERAVEIAKEMPNVWVVTGPGVTNLYVACKDDGTGWDDDHQAMLDALTDPDSQKEREFQAYAPDEVVAQALEARALGADVVGQATSDTWSVTVDGKDASTEAKLETAVGKLRDAADTTPAP